MLESGIRFKNGTTILLSEQYLVDCCNYALTSTCSRCDGCNGGWSEDALQLVALRGIPLASAYPYVSGKTNISGNCKTSVVKKKVTNTGYTNLTSGDASAFKTALQTKTVGVGVYVESNWYFYKSGVLSCAKYHGYWYLNHMVLLVGYTSTTSWKIKNSWGTGWGASGYMQITQNQTGYDCGILLEGITVAVI